MSENIMGKDSAVRCEKCNSKLRPCDCVTLVLPDEVTDKLLPCPFCGSTPVGPEPADTDWWIECENCEIIMSHDSKRHLVKMWNTRQPDKCREPK